MIIYLDFDCTLFYHDYENPKPIEEMDVIPIMKEKVINWLKNKHKIILFTARATDETQIAKLRTALDKAGLQGIKKITNIKGMDVDYYVDDKALVVEPNTGEMHCDPISNDIDSEIRRIRM